MTSAKVFLLGLAIATGCYYLRVYMKGCTCRITDRIDGKHVLITGANSGLGFETAMLLASRGGIIHMACRDIAKCDSAKRDILAAVEGVTDDHVTTHTLDLASLASVLRFTESYRRNVTRLDILINNAGVSLCPYTETADGFEMQIGVNHLGHFLLTVGLVDLLKVGRDPRIIVVSSNTHSIGSIAVGEEMNLRGAKYGPLAAYARSKLANVLHAKALARRLRGGGVAVVSLHPGVIYTDILRELPDWIKKVYRWFAFLFLKNTKEGCQTQVCCALDPNLMDKTGEYFTECNPTSSYNSQVYDEPLSEWLWQQSEHLIISKIASLNISNANR